MDDELTIPRSKLEALRTGRTYFHSAVACPDCRGHFRWAHDGECMRCQPEYTQEAVA